MIRKRSKSHKPPVFLCRFSNSGFVEIPVHILLQQECFLPDGRKVEYCDLAELSFQRFMIEIPNSDEELFLDKKSNLRMGEISTICCTFWSLSLVFEPAFFRNCSITSTALE